MHKRFVNHCTIYLTLIPDGPILIKSGKEGADPTKPDMEFVETYHAGGRSIYLPGSSLKGAICAHAERIVRTVGRDRRDPNNSNLLGANDPLNDKYDYLKTRDGKDLPAADIYRIPLIKTMLQTIDQKLSIQGSSLKGCIRSVYEAITRSCICKTKADIKHIPDGYKECKINIKQNRVLVCDACRTFGAMDWQGLLDFNDAKSESMGFATGFMLSLYRPRPGESSAYFN